MTTKPFMLQLMMEQRQPDGPRIRYDDALDELFVLIDGKWTPAVDSSAGSLMTKKKDIEKGEDAKDRW